MFCRICDKPFDHTRYHVCPECSQIGQTNEQRDQNALASVVGKAAMSVIIENRRRIEQLESDRKLLQAELAALKRKSES